MICPELKYERFLSETRKYFCAIQRLVCSSLSEKNISNSKNEIIETSKKLRENS